LSFQRAGSGVSPVTGYAANGLVRSQANLRFFGILAEAGRFPLQNQDIEHHFCSVSVERGKNTLSKLGGTADYTFRPLFGMEGFLFSNFVLEVSKML